MLRIHTICLPILTAGLAGCAAMPEGDFPSLAKRPYETSAPLVTPDTAGLPDQLPVTPALSQRLAGLRNAALTAHSRFSQQRGQGSGGDWAGDAIALAGLESARSEAMIPLADLDRLYIEAYDAAVISRQFADVQAIAATRAEVARMIADQDRVIAALGVS